MLRLRFLNRKKGESVSPLVGEIRGIDISNNNPNVNAGKLAAEFVYHKATEGVTFTDRFYAVRGTAIMARGIPFGAYHYARVFEPAKAQVDFFMKVAKIRKGNLIPFVDVEGGSNSGASGAQWRNWLHEWFTVCLSDYGRRCGIYVSPGFADFYNFGAAPWLADHPLFVAHWGVSSPRIPKPWRAAYLWQYTDRATDPGVSGIVDGDKWLPRCDNFQRYRTTF
jgi:GH25 family lysozyme M1 (1,4-beta-N-acetylmuramidase)